MESKEEWVRARLRAIAKREPRMGAETAMMELYIEFSPFVRNYVRRVWGLDADEGGNGVRLESFSYWLRETVVMLRDIAS